MADPVISGNGVFSHVFIGAADVEQSAAFYDAALGALGINNLGPFGNDTGSQSMSSIFTCSPLSTS